MMSSFFGSRTALALLIAAAPAAGFDHAKLDELLPKVVVQGRVHSGRRRRREAELNAYLKDLAGAKADALGNTAARTAFWINAYNAAALANVLDAFPFGKAKDVPGFFDAKRRTVAGQQLT